MFGNKIKVLKNCQKGKRCFILANGPSILSHDLNKLNSEIIIGMNASTLLEEKFNFKHTFYTVSDTRFIQSPTKNCYATDMLSSETIKVFREEIKEYYPKKHSKNTFYVPALKRDGFSHNIERGYYFGCTTVMLALQLARYIGCTEIYLLGIDLTYSRDQPRFYRESTPQIEDSFTSIQIKNIFNASRILEDQGVNVYNCNSNSLIRNYVKYMDFEKIFS